MLTKKFVSKNYNATSGAVGGKDKSSTAQSAPKAGGIAVFKGSTNKIGKTVGAAATPIASKAAPVPLNTPSVRRENNGRDPSIALVPVRSGSASGGNVWRAGGSNLDGSKGNDDSSFPRPSTVSAQSSSTAKPAPWARSASGTIRVGASSPSSGDAGQDVWEKRERSGSNLSASAGAAFAASLSSAGTVRPSLPNARPNVKKWAEIDSDEENESGDNNESVKRTDEPVVEVTDDMRFTTSNSVGGQREDGDGSANRSGSNYNDFGSRDKYSHGYRHSGTVGGSGNRYDESGQRSFRREGFEERDRSTAYNGPHPRYNTRYHTRQEEGGHGGADYYRNNRQRAGMHQSGPAAVSAKDGPYKPGPPPIGGVGSSFRKDTSQRDNRSDINLDTEERPNFTHSVGKGGESPQMSGLDQRSITASFTDEQMVIERTKRELEILQLQQQQLQSQLAQHEQRQQQIHHQQLQQTQQHQLQHQTQQSKQGNHESNEDQQDQSLQQSNLMQEFSLQPNGNGYDRWGSRNVPDFGPSMNAIQSGFEQRFEIDHRNFGIDHRGGFDNRRSFDSREMGGFYSRGGGFDRFQQRSPADAEPLWERAKRLPSDKSNENLEVNKPVPNLLSRSEGYKKNEMDSRLLDQTHQTNLQSDSSRRNEIVGTEPSANMEQDGHNESHVKSISNKGHVESGRSFASLFPTSKTDHSPEQHANDELDNKTIEESTKHIDKVDDSVRKSDFFTRDSYDEAADSNGPEMMRNDSQEPKKKMLFDPKSSKLVDSSLIGIEKRKQRNDGGKFPSKIGFKNREEKISRTDADRFEQKNDGKWAKRTLGQHQAGTDVTQSNVGAEKVGPPKLLQRRSGDLKEQQKDEKSDNFDTIDLNNAAMIVGNNMFPTTSRHMSPEQFQEYLSMRKELREQERQRRGPRTKGMLFRFNEGGEIERVLNDEERANLAARNEARQSKPNNLKNERHMNRKSSHDHDERFNVEGAMIFEGSASNDDNSSGRNLVDETVEEVVKSKHSHRQTEKDKRSGGRETEMSDGSSGRQISNTGSPAPIASSSNPRVAQMYTLNHSQMHHPDAFYGDFNLMSRSSIAPYDNNFFPTGLEVDPADAAMMGVQAYSSNRNVMAPQGVGIFSQQMNASAHDDMNHFIDVDTGIGDLDIQKMAAEADANRARQPIKSFIPGVGFAVENSHMILQDGDEGDSWNYSVDMKWAYDDQALTNESEMVQSSADDRGDNDEKLNDPRLHNRTMRGGRNGGRGRTGYGRGSSFGGRFSGSRGKGRGESQQDGEPDVAEGLFASIMHDVGGGRNSASRSGRSGRSGGRGGRTTRSGRYISGPPQIDPVTGERMVFKNKHYKREEAPMNEPSSSSSAKETTET